LNIRRSGARPRQGRCARFRCDDGVILAKHAVVELGNRPCRLDAGGPTADHDDIQCTVLRECRLPVDSLPPLEDVVLQADGVGQRVQRKRVLARSLHTEEVDLCAEREHQIVVGQRFQLAEADFPRGEVDRSDLVAVHTDVVLLVEEIAERVPYRRLLEQPGRDLVQQRLEGVVVVLVHEHDVDVALAELLGSADPAEAAAQDHDAGPVAARLVPSAHGGERSRGADSRASPRWMNASNASARAGCRPPRKEPSP
jgi:hypothetical protein